MKAALAAMALLVATPAVAQERADEPQWIYRDPEGSAGPVASFLSWNYRAVVLSASCQAGGTLMIEYFPDVSSVSADPPLLLIVDDLEAPMATTLENSGALTMVGRIPVDDEVRSVVAAGEYFQLDAPNEQGEPWHLGASEPLQRVVASCGS